MLGVFIFLLGVFFLMKEMDLIQGEFWGYFWPLLLIIFGFNMMRKGKNNCFAFSCGGDKHNKKHKHGKVVDDQ